jgi:hypothetical protein
MKLLNRPLRYAAIVIIDECKPTRSARVSIGRNDNLRRVADRAEVLPDIRLGCAVRKIADE